MSLLFWVPFGVGSVSSLRKEMNKPVGYGLPLSILSTTTLLSVVKALPKEVTVSDIKKLPGMTVAGMMFQGGFFCVGHLLTKMAYPVFHDDVPMKYHSKPIHT
jgi:hypothetical protein